MAFPRRLLVEGEELVIDSRPHWIALVGPGFVALITVVAWILIPGRVHGTPHRAVLWIVTVAAVVVLAWYPGRELVRWLTSHFVVTSDRVIHRAGLIAKTSMEIPLEKINDVRFHQGILERMVGAGDLTIESAGEHGTNVFSHIPKPEDMQRTIYHLGERNQQRMVTPAPPASPAAPSVTTELERLAELRSKGILTEEEFQAQKRKILGT